MQKILLYYKFTPLKDPEAVKLWQRTLCEKLWLKGRILVSAQGLNGTVGGELDDLKTYVRQTKQYPGFKDIVFKWSNGNRDDFPRLSVKVRDELVAFKVGNEIQVDEHGVVDGGARLKPSEVNEFVKNHKDVVFFDGRDASEAAIGRFKQAVIPSTKTSKDFIPELESGKYDELKDKPVVTYCTGGIRCEILSSLMKHRGFKEVYQLDGGIVKYGETYGDDGLWEGSLRVFDDRMAVNFSDHTKTIGRCLHCHKPTSNYENCALKSCNKLVLICKNCKRNPNLLYHSEVCRQKALGLANQTKA